jgi:drug/metabolite transporter (DMT)-like permease
MRNNLPATPHKQRYFSGYLFIGFFLFITTIIQIFIKTIALGPAGSDYLILIFDPLFYFCGVLFVIQAFSWFAVLRRLPLSYAYPFKGLTTVTILASGVIFFEEAVTLGNLLGTFLILIGVSLIATGESAFKDRV